MGRLPKGLLIAALLLIAPLIRAQSKTATNNGGTGQDSSAWNGCPEVTAGIWAPADCPLIVGSSDVLAQTTSQSTVNLLASAPASGRYRISYYANENGLCESGNVFVFLSFSWYDPVANRTSNSLSLVIGSTQSAPFGSIQGVLPIYVQSSTAVSYTSTVTGSCTTGGPASYDVHITLESVS